MTPERDQGSRPGDPAAMEPADHRRDDDTSPRHEPVVLLAAMEPADQRRDNPTHSPTRCCGRSSRNGARLSRGGMTNHWDLAVEAHNAPQWSPPITGGMTGRSPTRSAAPGRRRNG